jgi:gamma-glutamylcyclotransferase (GGCT)/AIG2-like uncharacterized protein YtfP
VKGTRIFCYGSNLDPKQLLTRCPGARHVCIGSLDGYRVDFAHWSTGWGGSVAPIRKAKGANVPGVVVELDGHDLRELDAREGSPSIYERRTVRVRARTGELYLVEAYVLQDEICVEGARPSLEYLLTILRAYRYWGFPYAAAKAIVDSAGYSLRGPAKAWPHRFHA